MGAAPEIPSPPPALDLNDPVDHTLLTTKAFNDDISGLVSTPCVEVTDTVLGVRATMLPTADMLPAPATTADVAVDGVSLMLLDTIDGAGAVRTGHL